MRTTLLATVATAAILGAGGAMAQAPEKADHSAPPAMSAPSASPSRDRRIEGNGAKAEGERKPEGAASHSAQEGGSPGSHAASNHASTHADTKGAGLDTGASGKASAASGSLDARVGSDARVGASANHRPDHRTADEGQKNSKTRDQSDAQGHRSPSPDEKSDNVRSNADRSDTAKSDTTKSDTAKSDPSKSEPARSNSASKNSGDSKTNSAQNGSRNNEPGRQNADSSKAGANEDASHAADRGANDHGRRGDNASANSDHEHIALTGDREKRVMETIRRDHVENITHVDFDVHVGTVVPPHYRFHPLPPTIVEYAPQYRGYDYILADDTIVIIQPHTHRIVDTIEENRTSAMNQPADCR